MKVAPAGPPRTVDPGGLSTTKLIWTKATLLVARSISKVGQEGDF